MIIGLGIDIAELPRIHRSLERFGTHFADKILHPDEMAAMPGNDLLSPAAVAYIAARFAAKEAGAKALGTGFSNGIGPHDIRIASRPSGRPVVSFHNKALERMQALGGTSVHVSLTHSRENAAAVVVMEGPALKED